MISVARGCWGALLLAAAILAAGPTIQPASARVVGGDPSALVPGNAPEGGVPAASDARPAATSKADALKIARRYLGGNPTGKASLWCADFMNLVERKAGRHGAGSRMATAYLGYGSRVSSPRPGDIVVLTRRGGGHVGYFVGWEDGQILLLSGNHGRKVGIGTYPKSRVLGYRRP